MSAPENLLAERIGTAWLARGLAGDTYRVVFDYLTDEGESCWIATSDLPLEQAEAILYQTREETAQ